MEQKPKLQITIDNKADVELFEFASSMASINNQYQRFITQKKRQNSRGDCKLYVNKVSDGSIIIDLCEKAPDVLPSIAPLIVEYSAFLVTTLNYLSGHATALPNYRFFREDFLNFKKILEPIVNVKGNNLNLTGINFGKTIVVNNNYTYTDSNAAQNQCDKEIKKLEKAGDSLIKENVNLKLYQARNSTISKTTQGNLGVIEEITEQPKVLSFANDRLRYDITKGEVNPLNFTYSVDVEVKLKDGSLFLDGHKDIKEYEVLKLHGPIENMDLFSNDDT
jgi:hypothetical protein